MFIYLTFLFDILIFLLNFYNTSLDRSITPEKRQNKKYCMYLRERERERERGGDIQWVDFDYKINFTSDTGFFFYIYMCAKWFTDLNKFYALNILFSEISCLFDCR